MFYTVTFDEIIKTFGNNIVYLLSSLVSLCSPWMTAISHWNNVKTQLKF